MRLAYARTSVKKNLHRIVPTVLAAFALAMPLVVAYHYRDKTKENVVQKDASTIRMDRLLVGLEEHEKEAVLSLVRRVWWEKGLNEKEEEQLAGIAKLILDRNPVCHPYIGCLSESEKKLLEKLKEVALGKNFKKEMLGTLELIVKNTTYDRLEYALTALASILRNAGEDAQVRKVIVDLPDNYEEKGDSMAAITGTKPNDSIRVLNFAYAFATIGKEITRELYEKFDIEYFIRYSYELLMDVAHNDTMMGDKILLVIFNKNDHNGAFYDRGRGLDKFIGSYGIIISEAREEEDIYDMVHFVCGDYGKINTLIIGGHGEPESILLGNRTEKGELDLSDEEEIAGLKQYFDIAPTIVLDSCSTGMDKDAIAGMLSRVLGARVFAPVRPNGRTIYSLDPIDGIIDVTYDVPHNLFEEGNILAE